MGIPTPRVDIYRPNCEVIYVSSSLPTPNQCKNVSIFNIGYWNNVKHEKQSLKVNII